MTEKETLIKFILAMFVELTDEQIIECLASAYIPEK